MLNDKVTYPINDLFLRSVSFFNFNQSSYNRICVGSIVKSFRLTSFVIAKEHEK